MDKDHMKLILENDKEWRAYMIGKLEKIEGRLGSLEIKVYSFIGVLFVTSEIVKHYWNK